MANEPGTAKLTLEHNGRSYVVDDFPADKFDELVSFAQTLTQPAVVPNMFQNSGFNSMANEPGTAQLTLQHNGYFVTVDNFPAGKFHELASFELTLTQPPPEIVRQPAIVDYYSDDSTFRSNIRASLLRFIQRRNARRDAAQPPQ